MIYLYSFLFGGLLCLIAQILIDYTKLTPARILVSYVVAGVILGGLGIYKPIVKVCGAGATVPLVGFGYAISKGVRAAIDEIGFMGIFSGGITATAAGITVALFSALVMALIFKSGDK